jgi:hypothetical protein
MRIVCLFVLLVVSGACSINHRSDQFACENSRQCDSNQTCQDGFCVTGGQPPGDGPITDPDGPLPPDAFVCPPQCTSCNSQTNTCTIDCNISATACTTAINCPAGFNCNVLCTRNNLCQNVNCSQAASCNVQCKGNSTCKNVTCGENKCDIECVGNLACQNVDCVNSCACDVTCGQGTSCVNVDCPVVGQNEPFGCSDFRPNVCTSEPDGCDTCP